MTRITLLVAALAALTISTTAQTRATRDTPGAQYVADIQPLVALQASTFREVVARYAADRVAMMRRVDAAWSPVRRNALRGFYNGWRSALQGPSYAVLDGRVG